MWEDVAGPTPPPSALALTHLWNLRKGAARLAERLPSTQGHTALSELSSAHLAATLRQAHCPSCRHRQGSQLAPPRATRSGRIQRGQAFPTVVGLL